MYKILEKQELNNTVTRMKIHAPLVASKALPGQFIILRVNDKGERIPLTISDYDRNEGSVSIIFQIVGATTLELNNLKVGDSILDFVGPLGNPTNLEGLNKVCIIGGGVGCAIALPIAKYLKNSNKNVTSIIGFKNKDLIILEDEFKKYSDNLIVTTDDGSYGAKGNVTQPFKRRKQKNTTRIRPVRKNKPWPFLNVKIKNKKDRTKKIQKNPRKYKPISRKIKRIHQKYRKRNRQTTRTHNQ